MIQEKQKSNLYNLGFIALQLLSKTIIVPEKKFFLESYFTFIPQSYSCEWKNILSYLFFFDISQIEFALSLPALSVQLKNLRNSLLSPLTEDETAIDSLLNMSRVITNPSAVSSLTSSKISSTTTTTTSSSTSATYIDIPAATTSNSKSTAKFQSFIGKEKRFKRGLGTFGCDFPGCTKAYGKKYTLNRHKKTHLALSAYVCTWCRKPFVDNSSLARHQRSHSGWKPFECPYKLTCGKRFAEANNRKQHIERIHKGIAFSTESNYIRNSLEQINQK